MKLVCEWAGWNFRELTRNEWVSIIHEHSNPLLTRVNAPSSLSPPLATALLEALCDGAKTSTGHTIKRAVMIGSVLTAQDKKLAQERAKERKRILAKVSKRLLPIRGSRAHFLFLRS